MTFGDRLREERKKRGLTQKKLAAALGRREPDIAKWEGNIIEPNLQDFENMRRIYGAEFVRQLLDLSYKQSYKDINWIETSPHFLPEPQLQRINTGLHLFHRIIKNNVDLYTYINGYRPEGVRSERERANMLYLAFQSAIQMGVLRLTSVPRNTALAEQVQETFAYTGLRHVCVVDIGGIEYPNYDCAPIRSEFAAFAAAQELFGLQDRNNLKGTVALGSGYTVSRTLSQSAIYHPLPDTDWVSLIAYTHQYSLPYSGNTIATHLATVHPGSFATLMPSHSRPDSSSEFDRIEKKLYGSSRNPLRAIVITVNGFGYDQQGINKINTSQRFVDGYSQDWTGSPAAIYHELDEHQKQSVAGELLGVVIDDDAQAIVPPRPSFSTQLSIDVLRDFRDLVWLVASMEFKARAVLAAIRSGLVGNLVIDTSIANWILEHRK